MFVEMGGQLDVISVTPKGRWQHKSGSAPGTHAWEVKLR